MPVGQAQTGVDGQGRKLAVIFFCVRSTIPISLLCRQPTHASCPSGLISISSGASHTCVGIRSLRGSRLQCVGTSHSQMRQCPRRADEPSKVRKAFTSMEILTTSLGK
jgi:hypothetical protein